MPYLSSALSASSAVRGVDFHEQRATDNEQRLGKFFCRPLYTASQLPSRAYPPKECKKTSPGSLINRVPMALLPARAIMIKAANGGVAFVVTAGHSIAKPLGPPWRSASGGLSHSRLWTMDLIQICTPSVNLRIKGVCHSTFTRHQCGGLNGFSCICLPQPSVGGRPANADLLSRAGKGGWVPQAPFATAQGDERRLSPRRGASRLLL